MADLSVGGLATGIDTKSLVSQLMQLERQPQKIMLSKKTKIQSQIGILNQINSALTTFKDLAKGMNTSTALIGMKSSVGDSTVLTASASSSAAPGTHTIAVTSLAKMQRQVSASGYLSASDLNFNSGSISITGGASPVTVTIAEGQNSLNGIASAINSSGAKLNASVINDGSGTPYRLVVTGKDTTNYTLDLSGLATAPANPNGAAYANPTFPQSGLTYQAGSPASFTLDGVAISKTSNTVTDAIPGVTLNLLKEGSSSTLTVENDPAGVTDKINKMVKAYNDAMTLINSQSSFNTTTKQGAPLSGDSTLRSVKSQLQAVLTNTVSGVNSNYSMLSQIGITTDQKSGTLSVNASKLSDALSSNFSDVVELFTHNSGTSGLAANKYGVAEQFNQVVERMTHSYEGPSSTFNGLIATRIRGLTDTTADIDKQVANMELLMQQKEETMKKQFTSMERLVSNLSGQGSTLLNYLSRSMY